MNEAEEVIEAINNTEDASYEDGVLTLTAVRYQVPEQSGKRSIRTGVFFLPEKKSPYQRYYTTGRIGYGGHKRYEGKKTYKHPLFIKGASGGRVPQRAYDLINGKGSYQKVREYVLSQILPKYFGGVISEDRVKGTLRRFQGKPRYAKEIIRVSSKGNTLAYAIQEHIVACSVRKQGYDAIVGYTKIGDKFRLSEIFDIKTLHYPIINPYRY